MNKIKIVLITIGLCIIGVILAFSITSVPVNNTGIVVRFGNVKDTTFSEGIHLKWFFDKVVPFDNHIIRADVQGASASKDLQEIQTDICVNYNVPPNASIIVYRQVNTNCEEILLRPAVQESVKSIISQYNAEEIITKRQEVSDKIQTTLTDKMSKYGINIENINILNCTFSAEFDKAIEAKQIAEQNALKAEQDLKRIEVEAQQKITKAKGEAEAYKIQNQQLTDNNIKMEWINKWDGKLPTTMASDDVGLMIK